MTHKWSSCLLVLVLGMSPTLLFCSTQNDEQNSGYEELVSLFSEFREFVDPPLADGVPDYSEAAMNKQRDSLKEILEQCPVVEDPRLRTLG